MRGYGFGEAWFEQMSGLDVMGDGDLMDCGLERDPPNEVKERQWTELVYKAKDERWESRFLISGEF